MHATAKHRSALVDIISRKCCHWRPIPNERGRSQDLKTSFVEMLRVRPGDLGLRQGGEHGDHLEPWVCLRLAKEKNLFSQSAYGDHFMYTIEN